jgi:DNA-binding GntR family transcriptional regulator
MTSTVSGGAATAAPASQPSLSARAYTAIRDMLITAEITPGSPVNEDHLAKKLKMGRTPVREAIKRLETERLVVVYPRRGIFATQVALSDLTLLTEVRVHLEGEAAFQAARRASRAERNQFEQLLDEAKTRSHDMLEEIDFDNRVHRAIYRAAHNSYLENTLEQYYNLTIRIWHVWTDRLPDMTSHVSDVIPLLDRIMDRDAEGARAVAIQHVSSFVRAVAQTP